MANRAIQACLLGNISNDSIAKLQSASKKTNNTEELKLMELAKQSSDRMIEEFCSSQNSINKNTCYKYAREQHNLIRRAFKFNENIANIASISPHIVNEDLIAMYSKLHSLESQSGMFTCYIHS